MFTLRIFVTLCQPEINDVNVICSRLCCPNQEIIRLDITVDDTLFVNFLDSLNLNKIYKMVDDLPFSGQYGRQF